MNPIIRIRCACNRSWEHICDATGPAPDTSNAAVVQAVLGLPARLRAHRAAYHLSMRQVAAATGVAASTVLRIERGDDFSVDSLIRIAAYLEGTTR